jgi:predicted  nucleic acid-binding Zn-ribbon protein
VEKKTKSDLELLTATSVALFAQLDKFNKLSLHGVKRQVKTDMKRELIQAYRRILDQIKGVGV